MTSIAAHWPEPLLQQQLCQCPMLAAALGWLRLFACGDGSCRGVCLGAAGCGAQSPEVFIGCTCCCTSGQRSTV